MKDNSFAILGDLLMAVLAVLFLMAAFVVAAVWLTVLPAVGLLYLCGWLT